MTHTLLDIASPPEIDETLARKIIDGASKFEKHQISNYYTRQACKLKMSRAGLMQRLKKHQRISNE